MPDNAINSYGEKAMNILIEHYKTKDDYYINSVEILSEYAVYKLFVKKY